MKLIYFYFILLVLVPAGLYGQYSNHSRLFERIKAVDQKSDAITVTSLGTTDGGKDLFVVTAGRGDMDNKPGIAVIAGIQGASLASTEIIMQMLESFHPECDSLLDEVTFYFFPCVFPDAAYQYFDTPRYERNVNATPTDDDRDGLTDEDGYDDLDQDGMISRMRILDPDRGDYRIHPDNPFVMIKADRAKNQEGNYLLMYEGIDNDKDGRINEDLPGGVTFNRNFSFNYPYFTTGAGENAFSAEESQTLARFLFDHWNIFAVLCIGPENNLSGYSDFKADLLDNTLPSAIDTGDKPYYESVSDLYRKKVSLSDSSVVAPSAGSLLAWAHFHYNRFAFSTPGWNVSKNKNDEGSVEFNYLAWSSVTGLSEQTVAWKKIDHPDFPGKSVETGGIKPFLVLNPPLACLDSTASQHLDFLAALAAMHPSLVFSDVKTTNRTGNVFLIEVEVTNTGRFPTMPVLAKNSRWVRKIRLELTGISGLDLLGGNRVFLFDRIVPGETIKAAWLVKGKGKISLKAGSPQTGFVTREIELN